MPKGVFQNNKIARRFAIVGTICVVLALAFGVMGMFFPEAFYGCREIPYHSHCQGQGLAGSCMTIDLASSTRCSFLALGWLTLISIVCAVECWLIALVWNRLGDKRKKSLRTMKGLLTAIPIYEMVITPLILFAQTFTSDELLEIFPDAIVSMMFVVVYVLFMVGLLLDIVWLVLAIVTWVLTRKDRKRV